MALEDDRWAYINSLDDELLKEGVTLPEWCTFIVRDADVAFVHGAHLASIITAMAGIETYLRSEYGESGRQSLSNLIDSSPLDETLNKELHFLRKYRNKWVHVHEPWKDRELLDDPLKYELELEDVAKKAIKALRQTIYENQWI